MGHSARHYNWLCLVWLGRVFSSCHGTQRTLLQLTVSCVAVCGVYQVSWDTAHDTLGQIDQDNNKYVTHSSVWHDSFIGVVAWLIHMRDMTPFRLTRATTCMWLHSYEWHDSFICVTWLITTSTWLHSYVWHDSFICVSLMCVTWLIHMCNIFICVTWLLLVMTGLHSDRRG